MYKIEEGKLFIYGVKEVKRIIDGNHEDFSVTKGEVVDMAYLIDYEYEVLHKSSNKKYKVAFKMETDNGIENFREKLKCEEL